VDLCVLMRWTLACGGGPVCILPGGGPPRNPRRLARALLLRADAVSTLSAHPHHPPLDLGFLPCRHGRDSLERR
jgi:hypothetical protein